MGWSAPDRTNMLDHQQTLQDARKYAGQWMRMDIYSPVTIPLFESLIVSDNLFIYTINNI